MTEPRADFSPVSLVLKAFGNTLREFHNPFASGMLF